MRESGHEADGLTFLFTLEFKLNPFETLSTGQSFFRTAGLFSASGNVPPSLPPMVASPPVPSHPHNVRDAAVLFVVR